MVIIHDKRLPEEYSKALENKYPDAHILSFSGPEDSSSAKVYDSIFSHPDIYFFKLDDKTVVHAPCISENDIQFLKDAGLNLIKGKMNPGMAYPGTSHYNASMAGDTVFHNFKYTDPVILEEIEKRELKKIMVSQGYTRCSMIIVNDNALITSDKSIADAAETEGKNVLFVSSEEIMLPGEQHGFIGGTGGKTPGGDIIFLGDLKYHSDCSKIKDFIAKQGVNIIDLECDAPLYDAGGISMFARVLKRGEAVKGVPCSNS